MDNMLSKALREFMTGPLNQLLVNLTGKDGDVWEEELKKFLRKDPTWRPNGNTVLLNPFGTITLPGVEKFIATDNFIEFSHERPHVAGEMTFNDDFKRFFLGKVEKNVLPTTLRVCQIRSTVFVIPDFCLDLEAEALGAPRDWETSLFHLWRLLQGNPTASRSNSENIGPMGEWDNHFKIRGTDGEMYDVNAYIGDYRWHVVASPLKDRNYRGGKIFFPYSQEVK